MYDVIVKRCMMSVFQDFVYECVCMYLCMYFHTRMYMDIMVMMRYFYSMCGCICVISNENTSDTHSLSYTEL